ncbi:MAG: HNH endonuclease [Bacteroidota bacterium]
MHRRVLILNQDFSPLSVCTVQRAFLLVYLNKADLVSEAQTPLRTVSSSFPMPSIIKLNRYVNVPYKGVVLTRQNVFRRDNFECQYCGATKDLTLDHVIPRSRGGKSTWKNLVTACRRCNARKGNQSPEKMDMKLRTQPIRPTYVMFLREFAGPGYEDWRPYLGLEEIMQP